ncbi:unnamed protein product, partial [Brenthis ino]
MLRNIIIDYGASNEISPSEYMKNYIEKCPETMGDDKISWVVETFLSIQKNGQFLKEMVSYVSKELSEEDQDYFLIAFHAITFQITPNDMPSVYKCLFNLSKSLLAVFATFLSNNEILTFISQVAQSDYDTNFVTEKIISPLFSWQPYISEMAHSYAQFVKKVEKQSIKQPTVPISPKVLNRRSKKPQCNNVILPTTPPNSLCTKRKTMLTKEVIDEKLKKNYDNNKQKALKLLKTVKTNNVHYAQIKPDKPHKKMNNYLEKVNNKQKVGIPKFTSKSNINYTVPVLKETSTTVKRINKRIELTEQEEIQWLQDLVNDCRNTTKIEELECNDRQKRERERLIDIERKHLLGQISYEEAIIAKKKLFEENKQKYSEFLKEKQQWEEEIEKWKRYEMEKNRKQVEKLSLVELCMLHAKNNLLMEKKRVADELKKESEQMLEIAMKNKQEELEQKIKMIQEIKILAKIAKKAKAPKIIDLTESSGVGLLCEMSIAELQEKLNIIKIGLKEDLENKKRIIKEKNLSAKRDMEESKRSIKTYMSERAELRKKNQSTKTAIDISSSKEINHLKNILDEKRKLRVNLAV